MKIFLSVNMKPARPWKLAHLKIIWQFHAHPVHQKVSRFFGPRYIGDDFFLGPNLVSFNRAVVPYEISKVNEDLLNIKRKGDPEVSDVWCHWNPEPVCNKSHFVSLFYLYWYFLIYQISSDILTRILIWFVFYQLIWNRHDHENSRIWKLSGNFTPIQYIKKCRDSLSIQNMTNTTKKTLSTQYLIA
jgi:hypothetical protein